uniref:ABC-type multidrug transport system, ATPase and permease component n=1 Tax=Candidatus Kentrum sp. UNK TaxID=2126344 RepID=A0A451B1U6_9GAMM|nr:MAG: ABC-type multidrug transport system, ATPase and permease component [Candidatus Kentron sp. UNK]VFK72242.1 MAG: ABC-type multidrug transport system, ATPase and permease component [Candidatus Kentron sp. UNK]
MPSNKYTSLQFMEDLWRYAKSYKTKLFIGIFFQLASNLIWLYPAYALASIVSFLTNFSEGDNLQPIWNILSFWVVAIIIHIAGGIISTYYGYQVAEKSALDVYFEALSHLLKIDLAWHEKENTGNKLKRIQNGSQGFSLIIRILFRDIIEIVVNFFGIIFIIATFDAVIAGFILFFMATFFMISYFLTKKEGRATHQVNLQEEEVNGIVFEGLNNIQTVKSLQMQPAILSIFNEKLAVLFDGIRYRIFYSRFRVGMVNLCGEGFRVGIASFIIWGILDDRYEVGFLVLFLGYFEKIWDSLEVLSDVTNEFIISKYRISRIMGILDEPIRIASVQGKQNLPENWKTMDVKDLAFRYDQHEVLKRLSFSIKRGEKVGIVGLSGGGKSTIFELLLKQREEFDGQISFDDTPIESIEQSDYLRHIAVVLQHTELFNLSLEQNILLASPDAFSKDRLEEALRIANISDFLHKLPQGIKTPIGEKGIKLSGGEKQRLGIARAVYRRPDILFLDEATSHLDIESEQKIQDALHAFFQKVTAIVIAHRLSTMKEMDRILVLEEGRIIEEGDFETLVKMRGRFYALWKRQKFSQGNRQEEISPD